MTGRGQQAGAVSGFGHRLARRALALYALAADMNAPSTSSELTGRATRIALVATLGAALISTGCVGLTGGAGSTFTAVDLDSPHMRQFAVASTTELERDVRLDSNNGDKHEKLTPALFWTGIVLGTVGAAGGIGFGAGGYATRREINRGYEGDGFTVEDRDQLGNRGQAFNSAAIAFTTAAVLGYALAVVTYGIDWNRCGPLVRKSNKRRCGEVLGDTDSGN